MVAIVQDTQAYLDQSQPGDIVLDDAPTPGNILILAMWGRSGELVPDAIPDGFTVAVQESTAPAVQLASWVIAYRVVQTGDSDTWTSPLSIGRNAYMAEWSGLLPPDDTVAVQLTAGGFTSPQTISPDGENGDYIFALFGLHTDIAGREPVLAAGTSPLIEDWVDTSDQGPYGAFGYIEQMDEATADYPVTAFHNGVKIAANFPAGTSDPEEPPIDPGYEPPDAGRAILEIYVHDEDATRWGTATWSADLTPTGTEGIWSGAGWQDVTPQGLRAHVSWGTNRPERGILAIQEAQSWLVETYDPDRRLDPGNADSPFYPQLVTGVPIRIRNEATGHVIRTGLIDRIRYAYRAPQYRGIIEASSTIAAAWRAEVPGDSILGDTLRTRVLDAHTASGITIGGIPIVDNGSDSYPEIDLSPQMEDEQNLWTIVYRAAQEVGWVAYEDAAGTFRFAPYLNPPDRGSTITYENLEDLESSVSEDGQYSVVRVLDPDGSTVHEIESAPVPRYGKIVYDDRESITTIDPTGFAAAVLADRAFPGVLWTPGTFWCFDAADVAFMAELEIMERVRVVVPGAVDVSGPLLGMELWVEQRTEERARWLFLPRVATTGSAAIGESILLADDDGSFLLADDEVSDVFLEPDDA